MPLIIQLRIVLKDVHPPVWRRVRVPATLTLRRLHDVIQAAMGWGGHHLHAFMVGDKRYGRTDSMLADLGMGDRVYSDGNARLATLVERGMETFTYTYDFGDDWRHVVTVEATMPPEPGIEYPRLVDARGACPPDDVGGPPGYEAFLEAIADPGHPDHEDMVAWAGTDHIDPAAVDPGAIEARLAPIRAARRKGPARKKAAGSVPSARDGHNPARPSADTEASALIEQALETLRAGGGVPDLPPGAMRRLIGHPDVAGGLVGPLIGAAERDEATWLLLVHGLDEARMDAEGDGARGPAFLAAVEAAVTDATAGQGTTGNGLALVASAYVRAGLAVPACLTAFEPLDTPPSPEEQAAVEQSLDESVAQMMTETDTAFDLHGLFAEALAGLPDAGKAAIVSRVARRAEAAVPRLILYWLLNRVPEVRLAAAEALAERLAVGAWDRPLMALLVALRRWMPADAARSTVDRGLAAGRGGLTTIEAGTRPAETPVIEAIATSVPDGTGAQQFAALLSQGDRRRVALVLLKTGHGVKDAFVLDGSSDAARQAYARASAICDLEVDRETLATAIGAALGEGETLGQPPPPGLVDVLEALPLDTLDPGPATLDAWTDRADPGGRIAAMTPQKRGRLVNESEAWLLQVSMADNWFETSGALEAAVGDARSETAARRAVFTYLEDRRPFWALQCFRGAQALRGAMALRLAESFAAVGLALLDGRPLKKIPIVEHMVDGTLSAFVMHDETEPQASSHTGSVAIDPDSLKDMPPPDAEALDRLSAYLTGPAVPDGTLTLPELDGFLHAVAIPARPIAVETWLPAIWDGEQPAFDNPDEAADVLATIIGRYTQIIDHLSRGDPRQSVILWTDETGTANPEGWAAGFIDGLHVAGEAWAEIGPGVAETLSLIFSAVDHPAVPVPQDLSAAQRRKIRMTLPERLPALVQSLWQTARSHGPGTGRAKVGRNDPCPCGSGRAYKRCCGA